MDSALTQQTGRRAEAADQAGHAAEATQAPAPAEAVEGRQEVTELASLTSAERVVLDDCESVIERGLKTFVEVGSALAMIRDNRLYRATHETFDAYCLARWGFDRTRAQNFITAARTTLEISNVGLPAPERESQARELARVPEEQRAEVWQQTVERTNGKPTAAAIRDTYQHTQTPADMPGPEPARAGIDVPAVAGHQAPEQRKTTRRPLVDAFRDAAYDLIKIAERIDRLVNDDRYPRNAEQVGRACRADLLRAGDLLAAAVDRVPNATKEPTE